MKETMNFSVSEDDLQRFSSADDLRHFYTGLGLNGLELMPLSKDTQEKVKKAQQQQQQRRKIDKQW